MPPSSTSDASTRYSHDGEVSFYRHPGDEDLPDAIVLGTSASAFAPRDPLHTASPSEGTPSDASDLSRFSGRSVHAGPETMIILASNAIEKISTADWDRIVRGDANTEKIVGKSLKEEYESWVNGPRLGSGSLEPVPSSSRTNHIDVYTAARDLPASLFPHTPTWKHEDNRRATRVTAQTALDDQGTRRVNGLFINVPCSVNAPLDPSQGPNSAPVTYTGTDPWRNRLVDRLSVQAPYLASAVRQFESHIGPGTIESENQMRETIASLVDAHMTAILSHATGHDDLEEQPPRHLSQPSIINANWKVPVDGRQIGVRFRIPPGAGQFPYITPAYVSSFHPVEQ